MLFKYKINCLVRSSSREDADKEMIEAFGKDFFENHFIGIEVPDIGQEAEIDLVKV